MKTNQDIFEIIKAKKDVYIKAYNNYFKILQMNPFLKTITVYNKDNKIVAEIPYSLI